MNVEDLGVVLLAGGEATRLPRKLELDVGGTALIVHVYRNVSAIGPVYVLAKETFPKDIDAQLQCPVIVDRTPQGGPLAALYSALPYVREPRVFVTAGDAPFVTTAVAEELQLFWEPGLTAVVPVNAYGRLEPLCALYDRLALIQAAGELLREGSGGVAAAVERMKAKRVRISNERAFANVNTVADRHMILEV